MPLADVTYRTAVYKDLPALTGLLNDLFTLESDFQADADKQRRGLSQLIDRMHETAVTEAVCAVFVAETSGIVIGMCTVQVLVSTAEGGEVGLVEDVIVENNWRGCGVGQGLLKAMTDWSQARGLLRLQLLVENDNERGQQFYMKNGWHKTQLQVLRRGLSHEG